jgi:hypothetical protein
VRGKETSPSGSRLLRAFAPTSLFMPLLVAALGTQAGCASPGTDTGTAQWAGYLQETGGTSEMATWTCTGDPCPWGSSTSNPALVWPAAGGPIATRLGYTVSPAVYLPAASANGITITITSGNAHVSAGTPTASSHVRLVDLGAGDTYAVSGIPSDQVISVQDSNDFSYSIAPTAPATPPPADPAAPPPSDPTTPPPSDPTMPPPADPTTPPPADPTTPPPADPTTPPPADPATPPPADPTTPPAPPPPPPATPPADPGAPLTGTSQISTWTCTGSPCPWGASTSNPALAWPASGNPISTRLGYTVDPAAYLPAASANGMTVTITSGNARISVGTPQASSHTAIATLAAGESYLVSGLSADQVISVQSDSDFSYQLTPAAPAAPPDPVTPPPPPAPPGDSTGGDPVVVSSVPAFWRCNTPDCWGDDWVGSAVDWPSWAAYQSNGRGFDQSRSVFAADDDRPLYPYMGGWAQGCEVTGVAGIAQVVEWQRGTDSWRTTLVHPGETHVIDLHAPEDGAMLESANDDTASFTVSLRNCTPRPLP